MPSRILLILASLLASACPLATQELPSFKYEIARQHELKPHRRTIPLDGVKHGFHQFHITLTVSPSGDVIEAQIGQSDDLMKFWPQVKPEVLQWKFIPFDENGKAATAQVEEYVDLVPPEQLPEKHVAAPVLRPNSRIIITLVRTGCFGTCPSYMVTVRNDEIVFEGHSFVVASGKHTDSLNPEAVQALAQKIISADFYSMESSYHASVTDNPTYVLSLEIDSQKKEVVDYVGQEVGMPAVIKELEDAVDSLAHTERWIGGSDGLVKALQLEGYNFQSFEAQLLLKQAITQGQTATVRELLAAGVPLKPLPAPEPLEPGTVVPMEHVGWLAAASDHPETLQLLLAARTSKNDQTDKDLALAGAARAGKLAAVRALIAYGANPNADLSKLTFTESSGGMTMEGPGSGSVLIYAAYSGNPDVVREILRYHPKLEKRDKEGKTAMFAAGKYHNEDNEDGRVECVRLLAEAGADVNARDKEGNTPLHEIFLTEVEEELLKLGADVNARNNDGETPIFTNVDDDSISLFIAHGADLTIRNNNGKTAMEVAKEKGPAREAALRKAMLKVRPH